MMSTEPSRDAVRINDLELKIHPDGSSVYVSLAIFHDLREAGDTDNLQFSIDYSQIPSWLATLPDVTEDNSLVDLNRIIAYVLARRVHPSPAFDVEIQTSQNHVVVLASYSIKSFVVAETHWVKTTLEQCSASAIIGVNEDERIKLQEVKFDITVKESSPSAIEPIRYDVVLLRQEFCQIVSQTTFGTIEALSSWIAKEALSRLYHHIPAVSADPRQLQVNISLKKPSAVPGASSAEVTISRSFCHYPSSFPPMHTVAIAFGSNLGDSACNIETALRLLEKPADVLKGHDPAIPLLTIVDTSFLYKTMPMYVTDQPPFINGACMVETNLSPETLLLLLKTIESIVGRVPSVRFGPRAVDLDIIFYDNISIDIPSEEGSEDISYLTIPHASVREREFVLRPLNDMIPTYVHPSFESSIGDLLKAIEKPDEPMLKTIPFPRRPVSLVPETDQWWDHNVPPAEAFTANEDSVPRTKLMATLNATPDSFSDGSDHAAILDAVQYAVKSVQDGASIVDVGGYSTRPGAAFVSIDEEISRVVPVIRAIRQFEPSDGLALDGPFSAEDVRQVLISVDTFRWEVAEAAILAGANCINDVYGFTGPAFGPAGEDFTARDPLPERYMREMRRVARDYAVPVIVMHSRGDAGKNKDYQSDYACAEDSATLEGIRVELGRKVDMVVKGRGGVRRWLVIVDPGVGFSKTLQGNLDIIKQGNKIVAETFIGKDRTLLNPLRGFPLIVGPSRKSFLGAILQQTKLGKTTIPKEREWATGAIVSELVKNRTLAIRVHNVKDMMDTIRTTEALYP